MTRYDWPNTDERTGTEDDYDLAPENNGQVQLVQGEVAPGWRRPIFLAGWGALVAVLLGLLIYGIYLLVQGPGSAPTTTTTPPLPTPQHSSSSATMAPSATPTTAPTASAPDTTNIQAPRAWPHLPSRITLPLVPSVVTLPPGL